jgi:hypothetical protein
MLNEAKKRIPTADCRKEQERQAHQRPNCNASNRFIGGLFDVVEDETTSSQYANTHPGVNEPMCDSLAS